MKKILFIVALLALAFSSAQACEPCGEIKILPTDTLKSCSTGESKTVEVLIYNPEYCYSNITDISLSDNANFDLNRSFGDVPCGDASTFNMRGYQYCTVGVTFKPSTTSGDFSTDIQVTDRDTGIHAATVKGEIKACCDGSKCDGKVTDLTLQYNGTEVSPLIEVFQGKYKDYADDGKKGKKCHRKGNKKNKIVKVFSGVVAQGETFEFFGQDKKGTLGTKIFVLVNGELAAQIHTSCSKPIGPDLVVGDFTVISGHSKNGGVLKSVNCPDDDMDAPVGECTTGNCDGKVTQLTLENLGASGVVTVTEKKTGAEIFNAFVATGDTFTFNGSDDRGTMGTEIYVAVDGVENVAIHTSCSKPIGPDMTFGDFKVIEGYSKNGGLLGGVTCPTDCNITKKVNYLAGLNLVSPTDSSHVYVASNALVFNEYYEANEGLAVVALDSSVNAITRLTFDVNQTAGLFMPRMAGDNGTYYTTDIRHTNRYGFMFPAGNTLSKLNFTTWSVGFTGVVSSLSLIEVADFNEATVVEKSCPEQTSNQDDKNVGECTTGNCDGKVTQLTLENLGASGVVTVTEDKSGNEIFNGYVSTGDTFTFNGSDDKGTMGVQIHVAVDGVENVAIHTSCSKAIGPDMTFGDFKVIEGYSKNGGLLTTSSSTECSNDKKDHDKKDHDKKDHAKKDHDKKDHDKKDHDKKDHDKKDHDKSCSCSCNKR